MKHGPKLLDWVLQKWGKNNMKNKKHTNRVTIETTLQGSTEDPIDFNCRSRL
jgi:hypothetical protein